MLDKVLASDEVLEAGYGLFLFHNPQPFQGYKPLYAACVKYERPV